MEIFTSHILERIHINHSTPYSPAQLASHCIRPTLVEAQSGFILIVLSYLCNITATSEENMWRQWSTRHWAPRQLRHILRLKFLCMALYILDLWSFDLTIKSP